MNFSVSDPFGAANDAAMPMLAAALHPDTARRALAEVVAHWRGDVSSFELQAVRVIRHKAGRRALLEYDLSFASDRGDESVTLIGKARAKGLDLRTPATLTALRQAGFTAEDPRGVAVPETVGAVPQFRMWLQTKVPGVPLTGRLTGADSPALARRVAEAAHQLHAAGAPTERRHTVADELSILRQRYTVLTAERPAWRPRLERLMQACGVLAASLPARPATGIHRDFYPAQILVDGARLWLLDFDLYCAGDPALDLGNFLGHLTELALREHGGPSALRAVEEALEERFIELAGEQTRAAVRAYQTFTLARHVSLSTQYPERTAFTEALIEVCEHRLGHQPR